MVVGNEMAVQEVVAKKPGPVESAQKFVVNTVNDTGKTIAHAGTDVFRTLEDAADGARNAWEAGVKIQQNEAKKWFESQRRAYCKTQQTWMRLMGFDVGGGCGS